jgi:hypothetical protein
MESAVQNFVKSTIRVEGRVRATGSLLDKKQKRNKNQKKTQNPEKDNVLTEAGYQDPQLTEQENF